MNQYCIKSKQDLVNWDRIEFTTCVRLLPQIYFQFIMHVWVWASWSTNLAKRLSYMLLVWTNAFRLPEKSSCYKHHTTKDIMTGNWNHTLCLWCLILQHSGPNHQVPSWSCRCQYAAHWSLKPWPLSGQVCYNSVQHPDSWITQTKSKNEDQTRISKNSSPLCY